MKTGKDREATEKRLLAALGEIIEESGLEFLGVNAVAQRVGVSKMLIYRYFGSLEELIGRYIMQRDYWVNIPDELPAQDELNAFVKNMFREQIRRFREDKLLIRLYRWELSAGSPVVEQIRRKREENGLKLIESISRNSGIPYSQIQFLATMLSSSISYLAMFGDVASVYNGYDFKTDESWRQLEEGINLLVDKWI